MPKKYQIGGDLSGDVYSGSAGLGLACVIISMITTAIIGGLMIALGAYLLNKKDKDTASVQATVTAPSSCQTNRDHNGNTYSTCTTPVTFNVGNATFNPTFSSSKSYGMGDKVTIYYNPDDPTQIELAQIPYKTYGYVLIGIGSFMIIARILTLILSIMFKPFRAFEGVVCAMSSFGFVRSGGFWRRY